MIKWRCRASHLGRFTLWNNSRWATQFDKFTSHLGRFTLWHNGCWATQLGRFTLWHKGHRATQLGTFTLWHDGRRATQLGTFTLWHNGRRATQLSKFTLWHNGRWTKPGLMHSQGVADIFQRQWRVMLKNMKAKSKVKFSSKLLKDEGFGRFGNHRSMHALQRFRRWTLYEDRISDLSKTLKDERNTRVSSSKWGKT